MNTLVSIAIALASFVGLVKYMPLSWLDSSSHLFGTSLTTIQGTDTLSSSRTVLNNNFSALNTGKFELSDWYATTSARNLVDLGIQNSGTGAVTVPYGGTGSTTLSSNQVLLGNGTGNISTVSGWGTSGFALVSNGGTSAPTWQTLTVDQTANYNWTGINRFKNLHASSTVANPITFNEVSYAFPSTQGASSTVLATDGSGNLSWMKSLPRYTVIVDPTDASAGGYATTTLIALPANTLTASSTIHVIAQGSTAYNGGGGNLYIRNASGTNLLTCDFSVGTNGVTTFATMEGDVSFSTAGSQTSLCVRWSNYVTTNGSPSSSATILTPSIDFTGAQTLSVVLQGVSGGTGVSNGVSVVITP